MTTKPIPAACSFVLLILTLGPAWAQAPRRAGLRAQPARTGALAVPFVAPDLAKRMGRLRTVAMPYRTAGVNDREKNMIQKLVQASQQLEDIYWRQSDPEGLNLYLSLQGKENDLLRRLLFINAGRFDLFDENRPFVGKEPMPPGRGFYPKGLTRAQIEDYVRRHPGQKAAIYSPYTVVRRDGEALTAVPYHQAFRTFLDPAAQALRDAAALSADAAFAKFLRLRADALLSDDYYDSDLAWLDLQAPKFDVIFAPYETYLDDLLGVKTSYGAAVLIRDDAETDKLAAFQKYVPDFQDALPLAPQDRPSKKGMLTPMEVMDAPFRAGDLRHGYQAVADNLPNDPRIHEKKGSKKIFFKNFMDARVSNIILPLAQRLLRKDEAAQVTAAGYFMSTLSHEISHGLGPAFARVAGTQVDIREAIGPAYSALEESKADVVGLLNLSWLADHGALTAAQVQECYAAHLADIFRTVRFGLAEAHSRGEIMQFNYFVDHGAIFQEPSGLFVIDHDRLSAAIASLARELLQMEATGDRTRVEKLFREQAYMPGYLEQALAGVADVPVDVNPTFSFPEAVR
jgi:hypothetical protein